MNTSNADLLRKNFLQENVDPKEIWNNELKDIFGPHKKKDFEQQLLSFSKC